MSELIFFGTQYKKKINTYLNINGILTTQMVYSNKKQTKSGYMLLKMFEFKFNVISLSLLNAD